MKQKNTKKKNANMTLCMISLLFIGMLVGSFFPKLLDMNTQSSLLQSVTQRMQGGFFNIFFTSVIQNIPYFIFFFVCSTSPLGVVLSPLLLCVKGMEIGAITSHLYTSMGMHGLFINFVLFLCNHMILCFCMIFLGKHTFACAKLVYEVLFLGKSKDTVQELKKYGKKFLSISVAFLLLSCPEILISWIITLFMP